MGSCLLTMPGVGPSCRSVPIKAFSVIIGEGLKYEGVTWRVGRATAKRGHTVQQRKPLGKLPISARIDGAGLENQLKFKATTELGMGQFSSSASGLEAFKSTPASSASGSIHAFLSLTTLSSASSSLSL